MAKFLGTLIHHGWGIVLLLASYPVINDYFDPASGGIGFGYEWQIALGLAPLAVILLMSVKQGLGPGVLRVAGPTYYLSTAYALYTIWVDIQGGFGPTGWLGFHPGITGGAALAALIGTWFCLFRSYESLRNRILLWLKMRDWYKEVMDFRLDMSADALHGLNWLMPAEQARREFPDEFGLMLGIPKSPENLALAWGKLIYRRVIIGRKPGDEWPRNIAPGKPIYYPLNKGMTIIIGPSRTGKFTSYGGNNLLNWVLGGSKDNPNVTAPVIVLDPKAENWAMTAIPRMDRGRRVVAIDPLNVLSTGFFAPNNKAAKRAGDYVRTHRWRANVFDFINPHKTYFESSLATIIDPLFPMSNKGGDDDFWNDDGKSKLGGIVAWIADSDTWFDGNPFPPEKRNLATVLDLLSMSDQQTILWLEAMATGLGKSIRRFDEVGQGVSRRIGNQMLQLKGAQPGQGSEKQWLGLVSTILTKLKWIDQSMRECMERSGCSIGTTRGSGKESEFDEDRSRFEPFDVSTIWDGKTDIYLILPDDQLKPRGPWLRMMVCAIAGIIKNNVDKTKGNQFCFFLDELAQVGGISELKEMSAYAAGKGIHVVMIFQALSQMKEQYGQDGYNTLMANAYAKILLGASDLDTAELINKHIGKTTIRAKNQSASGQAGSMGANISESIQTSGVDVVTKEEILGTSKHWGYAIFSQQKHVILFDKFYYYEDPRHREGGTLDGEPIYPVPNPFDLAQIRGWEDKQRKISLAKIP